MVLLLKHNLTFEEPEEIIVLHRSLAVLLNSIFDCIIVAEQAAALSRSFEIKELTDAKVFEHIVHDDNIHRLLFAGLICESNHV